MERRDASRRKALELAPSSAEVLTAFADALLGAGTDALRRRQFSEAIGHLVEDVRLRPSDAQDYLNLGKAYLESGNVGGAMKRAPVLVRAARLRYSAAATSLIDSLLA